jgi:hypothetical protein
MERRLEDLEFAHLYRLLMKNDKHIRFNAPMSFEVIGWFGMQKQS